MELASILSYAQMAIKDVLSTRSIGKLSTDDTQKSTVEFQEAPFTMNCNKHIVNHTPKFIYALTSDSCLTASVYDSKTI